MVDREVREFASSLRAGSCDRSVHMSMSSMVHPVKDAEKALDFLHVLLEHLRVKHLWEENFMKLYRNGHDTIKLYFVLEKDRHVLKLHGEWNQLDHSANSLCKLLCKRFSDKFMKLYRNGHDTIKLYFAVEQDRQVTCTNSMEIGIS